jgi:hypothetical protein
VLASSASPVGWRLVVLGFDKKPQRTIPRIMEIMGGGVWAKQVDWCDFFHSVVTSHLLLPYDWLGEARD